MGSYFTGIQHRAARVSKRSREGSAQNKMNPRGRTMLLYGLETKRLRNIDNVLVDLVSVSA